MSEPASVAAQVADPAPASGSMYDPRNPAQPAVLATPAISPRPCVGGESTLLIQDNVPWTAAANQDPLGANVNELEVQGRRFCIISASQISTTNLGRFHDILVSGAQTQDFYNNLFPGGSVHPSIASFVQNGGALTANLADFASGPGNGGTWSGAFVGGLRKTAWFTQDNNIVAPYSPLITGRFGGRDAAGVIDAQPYLDLDGWNFSSHGSFTNLPPGSRVVLVDELNRPVMVEYPVGRGRVVATMTTTEWRYVGGFGGFVPQNQKLLANEIGYQTADRIAGLGSLTLNGSNGYAEAPNAPELNITGDWTVEAWFSDDDPNGFNHDYRQILMKGDRTANPEAPFYILVGYNTIIAGVRTGGQDYPLSYDLTALHLDPRSWHHVAVTFEAGGNWLELWLDGTRVYRLGVPSHTQIGNTLPLEIGRNGPASGKNWLGEIDDVRIWNVIRTPDQITGNYTTQLGGGQPGLVANWQFDDAIGNIASDISGNRHDAVLSPGAGFSTFVHP